MKFLLPPSFLLGLLLLALHPASAQLRLSEAASVNHTGLIDDHGNRPDWIELLNTGSAPLDLAGWSLSDQPANPRKWKFQSGSLDPGARLIVFASAEDRQPEPAAPLEPDRLPGLVLRLRADALQPTDPTQVRVAGSDRFVVRWPDASRARRDATQSTVSRQPRWLASPVPAVRFDGVDDLLNLGSPVGANSFTLVAVVLPTAGHEIEDAATVGVGGTSGQRWLFGAAHGGDAGAGVGVSAGTNGVSVYEHGSGYMPARSASTFANAGRPVVLVATYLERVVTLSVAGNALPPAPVSPRNPVKAPTEIGAGAYGAFAGNVLEILGFDRALSDSERRGLEQFLAQRHQLLLSAPYHTNFRLAGPGDHLLLTGPEGVTVDAWDLPAMPRDVSFGVPSTGDPAPKYFANPTPGAANPATGATAFLRPPEFLTAPGFHTNAITVALSAPDPGVEIRYTLDGSDPGPQSTLYTGPIPVSDRTSRPNLLSAIPTAPGWSAPLGNVFKGTVVRARTFRTDALPGDLVTASYFVHLLGRGRYPLPVVSLGTDARNFFDPTLGIYVVGRAPGGNYAQSGDAWERPVHVEFFETNGVRVLAQESGVRMHGNTSFGFPLKALRLHPLNQRGTGPFKHRIFPDLPIESFDRLLLRPSGHDHYLTMMRDGLMQNLVRDLGLDLQGYRPAVVFLNGEFWGIHNLQEALEKNYFPAHHPELGDAKVDYLEGYAPGAYAYEGDSTQYHQLVAFLQSQPITASTNFAWVRSRMEVDNYRDYKLAEIFYYRWDIGNHRLWRPRTPEGRWRWILFDCDVGYGGFWSEPNPWSFDMLSAALTPSGSPHGHNNDTTIFLLNSLLRHPEFRHDFINRAADLMNGTFAVSRMVEFIDRMSSEIAPLMTEHASRWRAPASTTEWRRNVEALRTFARLRPAAMRAHLRKQFGLGDDVTVRLGSSDPRGGSVRCNTLTNGAPADSPWTGLYFRNHSITLQALPRPGWRFAGWDELGGYDQPTLELALTADVQLTARFVPEAPARFLGTDRLPNRRLRLVLEAEPATPLELESSPDLRLWSPAGAITTDPTGRATFIIPLEPAFRFHRVRKAGPGGTGI